MGDYQVYNLLDPAGRAAAARHVQDQMDRTRHDIALVAEAEQALAEVHFMLLEMKELAGKAARDDAGRQELDQKFTRLRDRIDLVAERYRDALSQEDAARLKTLLDTFHPGEKQALDNRPAL